MRLFLIFSPGHQHTLKQVSLSIHVGSKYIIIYKRIMSHISVTCIIVCICTYPRGRWEFRERGDVPGGHVAGQLEPIPADLLHADLLPLSYVKCGLHTGAGHYWCSWSGSCLRRVPYIFGIFSPGGLKFVIQGIIILLFRHVSRKCIYTY